MLYYRIKNGILYDYACYKYDTECQETDIITQSELQEHPNKVIVQEVEKEIDVPDYDEEGNPIMIEYEDTEIVIDYDEEGNPIGQHDITVIKTKQQTHKETITIEVLALNPNYETEEEQKERERINMLSLTKREVFLALYKDKGITPEQLRTQIIDIEALIEYDFAEKYYRGNPLINGIGALLGYTSQQLDNLFIYKTFNPPEPAEEVEPEASEEPIEEGE